MHSPGKCPKTRIFLIEILKICLDHRFKHTIQIINSSFYEKNIVDFYFYFLFFFKVDSNGVSNRSLLLEITNPPSTKTINMAKVPSILARTIVLPSAAISRK